MQAVLFRPRVPRRAGTPGLRTQRPSSPPKDSHASPKPGTLKTFTDWTAGCDNAVRCTLGSLLPGGHRALALRDAAALAAAIANAQSLKVLDANGGTLATLSLKGAAAALRYIDAQQGRAGSTDAIVARGPAP